MFGKSFCNREPKIKCWAFRRILLEKNVKISLMCGGLNSRRKVKYIWSSHFPEAITTNLQIGNDFFVFKYPVTCKQKLPNLIIFIEFNLNDCLLCAHPVMTGINLHTRRANYQLKVCNALGFYVSADFLFSYFEELKSTFFKSLHFAPLGLY